MSSRLFGARRRSSLGTRPIGDYYSGEMEAPAASASAKEEVAMWRVNIRISYFHDHQSRLRNHLATLFATMGLHNTNTGTWESASVPRAQATAQLTQVLQALANPQAIPG